MPDIQPNREEKYLTKDEAYDILYTALGNIRAKAYNCPNELHSLMKSSNDIVRIANEALKKVNVDF